MLGIRSDQRGLFEGDAMYADSQFITAVGVIPAKAYDGDTGLELTQKSEKNTGREVAEIAGDCAYGDGETRRQFREAGTRLEAPVPRPAWRGKIPKTEFRIGRKLDRVRCPAGKTTFSYTRRRLPPNQSGRRRRARIFKFAREDCLSCPLKESCVGERDGPRTITLYPPEKEMRRVRWTAVALELRACLPGKKWKGVHTG